MDNAILAYYQGIKNGSIVVGKWIELLYTRIVNGIEDGTYAFDQNKANRAIKFIERFMHHSKGALAPERLKLSLWQKAGISCIFGILNPETGRRQFREIFWVVGRKCGKTLTAAGIIEYVAYADGEYGSEIYCLAPKLDQADLVYSAFDFAVAHEPALDGITMRRGRKSDIFIERTNTTVKKIAFSEKKADGYSPQLTVCDEMASWPPERGLKQYEVMISGTGAREEPITLSISSSGYVNDGPYDELVKRGTRFLLGDGKETRLLPILYMIDDASKWDDINELRKSLPGMGVSVKTQFILDEINVAYGSLSKKSEFITKYANLKQNSSQAWLSIDTVNKCCGSALSIKDFEGYYAIGGLDLSQTTDLTSACVIVQRDEQLYVFSHFWLPAEKLEEATERDGVPYRAYMQRGFLSLSGDNFIDYHDCYDWFVDLLRKHKIYILQIGYDRYSAQYLVNDMKQVGFHMDDVYQGHNLSPVLKEMEGLMKDGRVHIGDNDLLKIHLLDSALKMDTESNKVRLIKLNRKVHIDGVAALSDAFCVRQKWWSEIGGQLSKR